MYGNVSNAYLDYVNRNYGTNVNVVFDGYEPSTKYAVHMRRTVDKSAERIDLAPSNAVTIAKEQFLSKVENKKGFSKFLSTEFKKAKFPVFQVPCFDC
ncbi:hypothetical protein AVEN_117580-1 [Araneus ventricosus]|uniref:Uncharacterized protein n=1 Tax=Araneus ventricosus TaxID=182803 RepID=A0A4Y2MVX8_ARAVE|nr:hypothetical protein AVEN_117580-1 [Araneus ventricosus]